MRMRDTVLLTLFGLSAPLAFAANIQTVVVPVADVWSESLAISSMTDPTTLPADKRETQILFGEQVSILKIRGPWALVEAIEQMEFTHHNQWQGYPGWVQKSALASSRSKMIGQDYVLISSTWVTVSEGLTLAYGSHFKAMKKSSDTITPTSFLDKTFSTKDAVLIKNLPANGYKGRDGILKAARQFLESPYLWGGLSPAGIDCSGLVHIAFRVNDRRTPRDSHDQWLMAQRIRRSQLKAGDVIFSGPVGKPQKITHVTIYAGDERIIEAPQTGMGVREIPFAEKYSKPLAEVESGQTVGDRVVFFGTFFIPGS